MSHGDPSGDGLVDDAVRVLRAGGLVAFPTETVYGLGADAENGDALRRVFAVKGRPSGHPLIVHVAGAGDLDAWAAEVPRSARVLAEAFWPGPLTMVLRRGRRVSTVATGGADTVGLRAPAHPVAQALLRAFGGAVAAPSANRFGRVSPTTAAHVAADLDGDVDLILDGGPCAVGVESTIVDLVGAHPRVLRQGAISAPELAAVLGVPVDVVVDADVDADADGDGNGNVGPDPTAATEVRAPGTLAAHYAPAAEVVLVDVARVTSAAAARVADGAGPVGVLAPTALELPDDVVQLEPAGDPDHYAHVLYDRLRQADRLGLATLLVVPPEPVGIGHAVRDRLSRAATGSTRS